MSVLSWGGGCPLVLSLVLSLILWGDRLTCHCHCHCHPTPNPRQATPRAVCLLRSRRRSSLLVSVLSADAFEDQTGYKDPFTSFQASGSGAGHVPDSILTTTITTTIMKIVRTMRQEFRAGRSVNMEVDEVREQTL